MFGGWSRPVFCSRFFRILDLNGSPFLRQAELITKVFFMLTSR